MTDSSISIDTLTLIQVMALAFFSFTLAMALTPLYTTLAYRFKWWKKPKKGDVLSQKNALYQKLHHEKMQQKVPTMAGVIFVSSTLLVTITANLSRAETWLPVAAMGGAACAGLIDDLLDIRPYKGIFKKYKSQLRLSLLTAVSLLGGWWFFAKLNVDYVQVPYWHSVQLGWLIVPLFAAVIMVTAHAVNVSDGLDGLAGGLSVFAFGAYALIAGMEGRIGVAGFCLAIVGALLSYTWFNIFPARFFMGDIGSFALGTALGVVAMLTDTVLILPIIAAVFLVESGWSALMTAAEYLHSIKTKSKKTISTAAPLHLYLEDFGWPETKVTMRLWVIGQVSAVLGIIVYIFGRS